MPPIRRAVEGSRKINCQPCRRRKARCDRVKPCANCVLHNCEDECYPEVGGENGQISIDVGNYGDLSGVTNLTNSSNKGHPSMQKASQAKADQFENVFLSGATVVESERGITDKSGKMKREILYKKMEFSLPSISLSLAIIDHGIKIMGDGCFLDRVSLRDAMLSIHGYNQCTPSSSLQQECLLFLVLSYACRSIPHLNSLASTYLDPQKSASQWYDLAEIIYSNCISDRSPDSIFLDTCILTMKAQCTSLDGRIDDTWDLVGRAIRRGIVIDLFQTEKHASPEYSRHFLVAHRLIFLDRWLCFNNIRPFGICRCELGESKPSSLAHSHESIATSSNEMFDTVHQPPTSLSIGLESKLIRLFEAARNIRKLLRYNINKNIEQHMHAIDGFALTLDREMIDGLQLICKRFGVASPETLLDLSKMTTDMIQPYIEWRTACGYIGSVVFLPFLTSSSAPRYLRRASFHCACDMLNLSCIFLKIIKSGSCIFSSTRYSNQIFSAFRVTFASKNMEDPLGSTDASLMDNMFTSKCPLAEPSSNTSLWRSPHTTTSQGAEINGFINIDAILDHPIKPSLINVDEFFYDKIDSLVQSGMLCIREMKEQGSQIADRIFCIMEAAGQRNNNVTLQSFKLVENGGNNSHLISNPLEHAQGESIHFEQSINTNLSMMPNIDEAASVEQILDTLLSTMSHLDKGQEREGVEAALLQFLNVPQVNF